MRFSTTRVYISSSYKDLCKIRSAVREQLLKDGFLPVSMETYGAESRPPLDICLKHVEDCEIYVGIVAFRYGSCPQGHPDRSFTELEYEKARKCGKPCLIFLLDEKADRWSPENCDTNQDKVLKFRERLKKEHLVQSLKREASFPEETSKAVARQAAAPNIAKPLPKLLPYLANRDEQIAELREIYEWAQKNTDRPVVCVVHGHLDDCHEKLMERLEHTTFREIAREGPPPMSYNLICPKIENASKFQKALLWNLSDEVLERRRGNMEEINNEFRSINAPILIHSAMHEGSWISKDNLRAYLDFWKKWPQEPLNQAMLVILFWKYSKIESFWSLNFWDFKKGPNRVSSISKKYSCRIRNQYHFLPKLGGVTRQEVENWLKREGKEFSQDEHVQRALLGICGDASGLPMAQWAEQCRKVFHEYHFVGV